MLIKGFQKMTLLDYPGKIACTLFLHGCNFRCGYCHNPELVVRPNSLNYSQEEILDFLEKRKNYLDGVCITGGESLFNIDIDFLRKIKKIGYNIKIDTNGSFPEKLKEIINLGLVDYIAMDIKASKESYVKVINAHVDLSKIEESIKMISNFKDYEFRTTIIKRYHNKEEFISMMNWVKSLVELKPKNYFLQGFKNQGKVLDSSFDEEPEIFEDYLNELKEIAMDYFERVEVRF